MASNSTSRSLRSVMRRSRNTCQCANATTSRSILIRSFSASASRAEQRYETEGGGRPKWDHTPEKMKAPFPWRVRDTEKPWECNSDPAKLDKFYVRFLGQGGDKVLSEEVKWLAITHKSFDQGRRGFNDRLAFFGRRILNLQFNLILLQSPTATKTQSLPDPSDDREPFKHPSLNGLANLGDLPVREVLTKQRLAGLAKQIGMPDILRWTPRMVDKLEASGIDAVLTSSLYALLGAIALEKGGAVAAQVAREKILKPLGIS